LAQTEPPPGTPPAFGTGPQVGPEVSFNTFKEAEKLVQVEFSERNLEQAAFSWRRSMAWLYERRTGPRKVALEATLSPATRWNPVRCPLATRTLLLRRSPNFLDGLRSGS